MLQASLIIFSLSSGWKNIKFLFLSLFLFLSFNLSYFMSIIQSKFIQNFILFHLRRLRTRALPLFPRTRAVALLRSDTNLDLFPLTRALPPRRKPEARAASAGAVSTHNAARYST